jgi:transporter family protein
MDWITLSFLAALLFATSNMIDKFLLEKWVKNPLIPLHFIALLYFLSSILIFSFHKVTPLSTANLLLVLLAGLLNTITMVFYFKALSLEEVSRIVPLFNITPLFIMIFAALFLGEIFTPLKYLGILLLVAGSVLIGYNKGFRLGKSAAYMIICLIAATFYQITTKYLLGFADYWSIFAYGRLSAVLFLIPVLIISYKDLISTLKKHAKNVILSVSASELIALAASILAIAATSLGPVTLVNALGGIQPFFVLLVTVLLSRFLPHILEEEISKKTVIQKMIACTLIFVGVFLVT